MKFKKLTLATFVVILSTGLLFGSDTADDEQEMDPTEESSEQQLREKRLEAEQNQ